MKSSEKLSSIRVAALYGGTPFELSKTLMSKQVHILFATPGRLHQATQNLDLVTFENVHALVLDEMQVLATKDFQRQLAPVTSKMKAQSLQPFVTISLGTSHTKQLIVELRRFAYYREDPRMTLLSWDVHQLKANQLQFFLTKTSDRLSTLTAIIAKHPNRPIIIYTRTRADASNLVCALHHDLVTEYTEAESPTRSFIRAHHGDLSQIEREENILDFLNGEVTLLVTCIPPTGLHFPNNPTIIQYQLPVGTKEQAFSTW
jgi:superfamily II DNA/RNA helicase